MSPESVHYLLGHVLPQIFKVVEVFSRVANSFVVDVSRESVVPAALHVDGDQINANLSLIKQVVSNLVVKKQYWSCFSSHRNLNAILGTTMNMDFLHFVATNGYFCFPHGIESYFVCFLLLNLFIWKFAMKFWVGTRSNKVWFDTMLLPCTVY